MLFLPFLPLSSDFYSSWWVLTLHYNLSIRKYSIITSLEVRWLAFHLPKQGVWVPSLVGELRSHMPHGQKKQNIKQKQYCNKFNKDFKIVPYRKSLKKKEDIPWDYDEIWGVINVASSSHSNSWGCAFLHFGEGWEFLHLQEQQHLVKWKYRHVIVQASHVWKSGCKSWVAQELYCFSDQFTVLTEPFKNVPM